ncbi:arsenate reductase ArsC [candidate division KSB1 bacterium]
MCTGNSCRSQMAEGWMRKYFNDKFIVFSAGVKPTDVNPDAIKVMKEIGIDISKQKSKSVELFLNEKFDYLITVCDNAKETCPLFTGNVKSRLHWSFEDPAAFSGSKEEKIKIFRKVRDLLKDKLFGYFNPKN